MIFFKLGFRNFFRNKRRSLISCLTIGMGLAALIVGDGVTEGMLQNMVKTATSGLMGEAQVHHRQFTETQEPQYTIDDYSHLKELLQDSDEVKNWTARAISLGMIASARNSKNVMVYGIDPKSESKVTKISKFITQGDFLSKKKVIVLGRKLLKDLSVHLGDKVVVTVATPETGELAQDLFRIQGVISFGSDEADSAIAFINISDLQKLLMIGDGVHEVVIKVADDMNVESMEASLWAQLSSDKNIAQGWNSLMPSMTAMLEYSKTSTYIIGLIMFALVSISIINTLFMSIYERIFEFGVLRAIGTKRSEVMKMVFFEGLVMGIASSLVGMLMAGLVAWYLATKGLDYGGIEFNNVVFREPIYFIFSWRQWTLLPLTTIAATALIGLYPANFASKITLAHGLKKTI